MFVFFFFFSSRRRHTRWPRDWSSDVCSSDLCAALDRFTGAGKSKEDWIHISRDAEAIVINVPTGTQDHYPPAFGGAAAIELPPGGEHRVELRVNLDELERRVVVKIHAKLDAEIGIAHV